MNNLKILCIGPLWRGSNAGALFKALSRQGALINIVDEFYHIPLVYHNKLVKVVNKLLRPLYIKSFNQAILHEFQLFEPEVVLVYKGAFVYPSTLKLMKKTAKVVSFYPDVSFHTHGNLLKHTLPLYQLIFTTKTFGIEDMKLQLGQENGVFIPHGFDPEIHRKIDISEELRDQFACDASFIGTWSPHKERYLTYLVRKLPNLNLKIWGAQWDKASNELRPYIQNTQILGDLYAIAIQCSTINIALLSEKVKGASDGDRITSRTFHIPAAGGFMLHQDSEEIALYYDVKKEIGLFDSIETLASQTSFYLDNKEKREEINQAGYARVQKEHSLDNRAEEVLDRLNKLFN